MLTNSSHSSIPVNPFCLQNRSTSRNSRGEACESALEEPIRFENRLFLQMIPCEHRYSEDDHL